MLPTSGCLGPTPALNQLGDILNGHYFFLFNEYNVQSGLRTTGLNSLTWRVRSILIVKSVVEISKELVF